VSHDADEGTSVPVEGMGRRVQVEYARVARRGQIREVIFGAQDGLLSTLALVTGVRGADAVRETILVAGLAGALAGTVSMALGAYIAAKSQREVFDYELTQERAQLRLRPNVEQIELAEIFMNEGLSRDAATVAARAISENEEAMLKTMAEKELGIRFEATGSPLEDSAIMGTAFAIGSALPIVPYVVLSPTVALVVSVVVTLAALFSLGVVKARLSAGSWWRSGLEIAGLAGGAALLAYVVGQGIPTLLGISTPVVP
jgi:predicted membrane protein (TIGR00267 family)